MLPRSERLARRRDFAAVYARKKSWANPLLALYVRRHTGDEYAETRRFGFSVSKKVGKATVRNTVKRRLRALCRARGEQWWRGFDVVLVARAASASASYAELESAVCDLMTRAGLLAGGPAAGEPARRRE